MHCLDGSARVKIEADVNQHIECAGTSKSTEERPESTLRDQSLKRKLLSEEKIHEFLRIRTKLEQRLEKLQQREVLFEDEEKEQFYLNNELKVRKSIVEIERVLCDNGVLTELDDDLRFFHLNKCQARPIVLDTGNKILNEKLEQFMTKKSNKKYIAPSFDELNSIMREVRKQEGDSSNIPDPEHDNHAFLSRLENVAYLVTRAHQKLISKEFLEDLDYYVPKKERRQCSTLPNIESDLRSPNAANEAITGVSDEVLLREMRAAGRLEQENPAELSGDEEIEVLSEDSSNLNDDESVSYEYIKRDESLSGSTDEFSGSGTDDEAETKKDCDNEGNWSKSILHRNSMQEMTNFNTTEAACIRDDANLGKKERSEASQELNTSPSCHSKEINAGNKIKEEFEDVDVIWIDD